MLSVPDSQRIRLEELIRQRSPLRKRFEENPSETHLAIQLKTIDDQIAECNRQIQSLRVKVMMPNKK